MLDMFLREGIRITFPYIMIYNEEYSVKEGYNKNR